MRFREKCWCSFSSICSWDKKFGVVCLTLTVSYFYHIASWTSVSVVLCKWRPSARYTSVSANSVYSDQVLFSNLIRTFIEILTGISYKRVGVSCELLVNVIQVTYIAPWYIPYLLVFHFVCDWTLLPLLFRQRVTKHLTPELNPSAQRCLPRFFMEILLLEPCVSLTYAWKNNKCNNYSFSLSFMYGISYMFRHYISIFRERS
jgi:hypothetical protein